MAATYSRGIYKTTTIGKTEFDGRVRNGIGSDHSFIATKKRECRGASVEGKTSSPNETLDFERTPSSDGGVTRHPTLATRPFSENCTQEKLKDFTIRELKSLSQLNLR